MFYIARPFLRFTKIDKIMKVVALHFQGLISRERAQHWSLGFLEVPFQEQLEKRICEEPWISVTKVATNPSTRVSKKKSVIATSCWFRLSSIERIYCAWYGNWASFIFGNIWSWVSSCCIDVEVYDAKPLLCSGLYMTTMQLGENWSVGSFVTEQLNLWECQDD